MLKEVCPRLQSDFYMPLLLTGYNALLGPFTASVSNSHKLQNHFILSFYLFFPLYFCNIWNEKASIWHMLTGTESNSINVLGKGLDNNRS